jgi:opacity protein-like surface antigen
MRRFVPIACVVVALLSSATWAGGRPDKPWKSWFGQFSAGYAFVQGDAGDTLDDDWFLTGGAMYWPGDWPVGLSLDLGYVDFGVSKETIDRINDIIDDDPQNEGRVDGGNVEIWQLTANGVWGPGKSDGTGFYVTAGVGAYYVEGTLNEIGLVAYPPWCQPYWPYYCYPGGVGSGKYILARETTTQFGWNVGVGFGLEVGGSGSQVILEARYHSVNVNELEYLPVTVGYRW